MRVNYIKSCGNGEVFNPDFEVCDDPENVPGCNAYSLADYYQVNKDIIFLNFHIYIMLFLERIWKKVGKETGRRKCPDLSTDMPDPSTTNISTASPGFTCPDSGNYEYAICSSFYYVCIGGPGGNYIIAVIIQNPTSLFRKGLWNPFIIFLLICLLQL